MVVTPQPALKPQSSPIPPSHQGRGRSGAVGKTSTSIRPTCVPIMSSCTSHHFPPSTSDHTHPLGNRTVFRLLGTIFGSTFLASGPLPRTALLQTPQGLEQSCAREGAWQEGSARWLGPRPPGTAFLVVFHLAFPNAWSPCGASRSNLLTQKITS